MSDFFNGWMPPTVSPRRNARDAFGRVSIPASASIGNTPDAAAKIGIVEGRWDDAVPRCVQIAAPYQTGPQATAFPPGPADCGFPCGLIDAVGTFWGDSLGKLCALVLEYGHGAVSDAVWCDYYAGAYNLPPCSWVRVSALPWRTSEWALNNQVDLQASIGLGNMQDAKTPMATGQKNGSGTIGEFIPPAHARAFEVSGSSGTVATSGASYCSRNYTTGQFVPGYDPIDVNPGPTAHLLVTSSVAQNVTLRWLLQL